MGLGMEIPTNKVWSDCLRLRPSLPSVDLFLVVGGSIAARRSVGFYGLPDLAHGDEGCDGDSKRDHQQRDKDEQQDLDLGHHSSL